MSEFRWTSKTSEAAYLLAQGYSVIEVAKQVEVNDRTIYRWKLDDEFSAEVDRLSLMIGIASRAERIRIAQSVVRQKMTEEGGFRTEKDLLDWIKFAQGETDGVKLDLANLLELTQNDTKK